ncbi:MAG: GNAT family N-acetyltransferase [Verrucomicrobiota bacterium]
MTIERITAVDLPALADLYDQLVTEKTDRGEMKRVFAQLDGREEYYLLGAKTEAGKLAGCIMGIVCLDLLKRGQPFMVMENMIVDSEWRGRGVGKKLMERLEGLARERGCIFIQFCSSSYRKEAHGFYEACGYDPAAVQGYRKFL